MYDLHNVTNLSVDVSHVLILSYYNKICLKQTNVLWNHAMSARGLKDWAEGPLVTVWQI